MGVPGTGHVVLTPLVALFGAVAVKYARRLATVAPALTAGCGLAAPGSAALLYAGITGGG
ncbi:hypothetical protein ACIBAI_05500 [Streptomyces sp. NPDC051041]|uniref:hypothetical protein n=1 Tax=Streptomyces sp. NPDC051041 TaxID=3365640 RepID=UPI0037906E91